MSGRIRNQVKRMVETWVCLKVKRTLNSKLFLLSVVLASSIIFIKLVWNCYKFEMNITEKRRSKMFATDSIMVKWCQQFYLNSNVNVFFLEIDDCFFIPQNSGIQLKTKVVQSKKEKVLMRFCSSVIGIVQISSSKDISAFKIPPDAAERGKKLQRLLKAIWMKH